MVSRRVFIKKTLYDYFKHLYKHSNSSQIINTCLFRLLICSNIGEIVANLNSFMTHFRNVLGTNVSVL
jgi:hypothetical protein